MREAKKKLSQAEISSGDWNATPQSGLNRQWREGEDKWNFGCTIWFLFVQHYGHIWSHPLASEAKPVSWFFYQPPAPHKYLRYNVIINHWPTRNSLYTCPTQLAVRSCQGHSNAPTHTCYNLLPLKEFPVSLPTLSPLSQLPVTSYFCPTSNMAISSWVLHLLSIPRIPSCHLILTSNSQGSIYNFHSPYFYSHLC